VTPDGSSPREQLERRIASVTYGYRHLSLEGALKRIAANGFTAVEIVGTRPHMLPADYPADELEALAAQLELLGLDVVAIAPFSAGSHWHYTHANARVRAATVEHVKRCIDIAARLGAPVVQSITGAPVIHDVPPRAAWSYARDGLRACAEYADAHGVRIGLEGEDDTMVRTSADQLEMIADVDHPGIGALFDIGHANMLRGDDAVRAAAVLAPHLVHVHVHDNDGWRDDHAPVGSGTIDWPQVARALAGYDGAYTIEVGSRNPDGVASAGRALLAGHLLAAR
jgi:sugar phosphate isomerase/epimerase